MVWIVNVLVALLSFLIWRKTPALLEVQYPFDSEDTKKTVNAVFTMSITIFCLSILPTLTSGLISYLVLAFTGLPLHSFSVWAFYIPHGMVLMYFVYRICKTAGREFIF